MGRRRKIHEYNPYYAFFRPYVDMCIRHSYRGRIKVEGEENIPKDGAVILAPNHSNTLMDALVVLQMKKGPTVFGARADLFNTIGPMLRFFKILPMVRKRDGLRNVVKNLDTMEEVIDTLVHKIPFCMFCEGTHRPKHSLMPVTKGIVRIAFNADEQIQPVNIVPVGIDYGDYFRYRDTCRIRIGEPINITQFLIEAREKGTNEADCYRAIREELYKRISSLITFIDDDENYDARWILKRHGIADDPAKYEAALEFEKARKAAGISAHSFGQEVPVLRFILKALGTVVGLPVWLACAAITAPQWLIILGLRFKIKDRAFLNSVRCIVRIAISLVITIPFLDFVYDYMHFTRIYFSDIKLAINRPMARKFRALRK